MIERTMKWFLICELIPEPKWSGTCYGADNFIWLDERPMPTETELDAAYADYLAGREQQDKVRQAHKDYYAALEQGYLHTDGSTYYCNERATSDMTQALALFGLDSEEPLPVIDMAGTIHMLYIDDFKELAGLIGRHQYSLRMTLWDAIK